MRVLGPGQAGDVVPGAGQVEGNVRGTVGLAEGEAVGAGIHGVAAAGFDRSEQGIGVGLVRLVVHLQVTGHDALGVRRGDCRGLLRARLAAGAAGAAVACTGRGAQPAGSAGFRVGGRRQFDSPVVNQCRACARGESGQQQRRNRD